MKDKSYASKNVTSYSYKLQWIFRNELQSYKVTSYILFFPLGILTFLFLMYIMITFHIKLKANCQLRRQHPPFFKHILWLYALCGDDYFQRLVDVVGSGRRSPLVAKRSKIIAPVSQLRKYTRSLPMHQDRFQ